jgi:AbrB family transcriptional regulator, transcriptional pleiotropic regulator of transition state genes
MRKAAGVVRRVDDLGRIVIPKEIRDTHEMPAGCPLEIYVDGHGAIMLKKYQPGCHVCGGMDVETAKPIRGHLRLCGHCLQAIGQKAADRAMEINCKEGK